MNAILKIMVEPIFQNSDVADKFSSYSKDELEGLLILRVLILETAEQLPEVGEIEETLKWGQPSYLTKKPKSGSTIRLGVPKSDEQNDGRFAIYTHCQTTLISDFQNLFPDDFTFEGNRAIHFSNADDIPIDKLRLFVSSALTYHVRQKSVAK